MKSDADATVLLLISGWESAASGAVNLGDAAQYEQVSADLGDVTGARLLGLAHSQGLTLSGDTPISDKFATYLFGAPRRGRVRRAMRTVLAVLRALALVHNAGRVGRGLSPTALSASGREVLDEVARAQVLFLAGSGNFVDVYMSAGGVPVRWALAVLIADRSGVPVVASGQQIGPLNKRRSRLVARIALRRVALLGVREPASARCAVELGVPPYKVILTGDDAWYLPPADPELVDRYLTDNALPERFVAAQIRFDRSNGLGPRDGDRLARLLDRVSEALQLPIVFLSFHEGAVSRDRHAAALVTDAMKAQAFVAPGPLDARLAKGVLARAELAIGGANHFCVFAASSGVPCVAVHRAPYLRHKLDGLAELWPDVVHSIDLADPDLERRVLASLPELLIGSRSEVRPSSTVHPRAAIEEAAQLVLTGPHRGAEDAGR